MRTIGLIVKQPPKFTCPVCKKEYRRESDLAKHIEKEHPDYKPSGADT